MPRPLVEAVVRQSNAVHEVTLGDGLLETYLGGGMWQTITARWPSAAFSYVG